MAAMRVRGIAMLALVALVSACAPTGATPLSISNGTTIPVTIIVNGNFIATVEPKTDRDLPAASLPHMPWAVEARTVGGRRLLDLTVNEGDAWSTTRTDGSTETLGSGGRVDLSCGRLDISYGGPLLGPIQGMGSPGDCGP